MNVLTIAKIQILNSDLQFSLSILPQNPFSFLNIPKRFSQKIINRLKYSLASGRSLDSQITSLTTVTNQVLRKLGMTSHLRTSPLNQTKNPIFNVKIISSCLLRAYFKTSTNIISLKIDIRLATLTKTLDASLNWKKKLKTLRIRVSTL